MINMSRERILFLFSDVMSYAAYGEADQALVADQKMILQRKFKKYFRIKVFMPKPGGGTFIDG